MGTMASEKDFRSPIVGKYLEKYCQGSEGVATEDRMQAFRLIEDLLASEFAGWYHFLRITGETRARSSRRWYLWDATTRDLDRRPD